MFFSVKTADMKRTNGLGSANVQRMEYVLWKSRFLFSKSASAKLIKDAEVVALKHVEN